MMIGEKRKGSRSPFLPHKGSEGTGLSAVAQKPPGRAAGEIK